MNNGLYWVSTLAYPNLLGIKRFYCCCCCCCCCCSDFRYSRLKSSCIEGSFLLLVRCDWGSNRCVGSFLFYFLDVMNCECKASTAHTWSNILFFTGLDRPLIWMVFTGIKYWRNFITAVMVINFCLIGTLLGCYHYMITTFISTSLVLTWHICIFFECKSFLQVHGITFSPWMNLDFTLWRKGFGNLGVSCSS